MKISKFANRATLWQFIKYVLVGMMNTLITLIVIFVCKSLLGVNEYISNAIGYVAGLINSFLWNKNWVFKVKEDSMRQVVRFIAGFIICYGLQLFTVWTLTENTPYGDMIWTVSGFHISGYEIGRAHV